MPLIYFPSTPYPDILNWKHLRSVISRGRHALHCRYISEGRVHIVRFWRITRIQLSRNTAWHFSVIDNIDWYCGTNEFARSTQSPRSTNTEPRIRRDDTGVQPFEVLETGLLNSFCQDQIEVTNCNCCTTRCFKWSHWCSQDRRWSIPCFLTIIAAA